MTRTHRRVWLDTAIAVLLALLAGVGAVRWVDTTWQPAIVLQTLGPFVVVGLVILLVTTAVVRRWWMLLPVGMVTTVALWIALPTWFATSTPDASRAMTVMSANLMQGTANTGHVMAAVRARAADVLVLVEATPAAVADLRAAGLGELLPHSVEDARPDAPTRTMVFSRLPLTRAPAAGQPQDEDPARQPEVTFDLFGTEVRLKAVRVLAPIEGNTQVWRAGLRGLEAWKQRQPEDEVLVLAGDFNADYGHPGMRAVADGLVDAHVADGHGWVRTWPFVGQRMPAYVHLDHVLTRGLVVMDAGQEAIHGTDHAIVWGAYALES